MTKREAALAVITRVSRKEPSEIIPQAELVANLGMDSARSLELLVELEDELGVEISDEDAAAMITVGDILDYVATLEASG
jgi:acyl carrier protein